MQHLAPAIAADTGFGRGPEAVGEMVVLIPMDEVTGGSGKQDL